MGQKAREGELSEHAYPLHGGTTPCSEILSFLGNELREGVFRTFGFSKPKRFFSRIKLVTKNDLAPRRGYCWGHASSLKVLQEETPSVNPFKRSAEDTTHEASAL
jgi:hypothetical protein